MDVHETAKAPLSLNGRQENARTVAGKWDHTKE
jgi:hypothetical protein